MAEHQPGDEAVEAVRALLPDPLRTFEVVTAEDGSRIGSYSEVDRDALASQIVASLPSPVEAERPALTAEEAAVLLSGVIGWDEAELDAKEALHDQAMAKLRAIASLPVEEEAG